MNVNLAQFLVMAQRVSYQDLQIQRKAKEIKAGPIGLPCDFRAQDRGLALELGPEGCTKA